MKYSDLRDFIAKLKQSGELIEVSQSVSPILEMTELCDRTLRAGGPALLFTHPTGHSMPVLGNLFGTPRRVALGMGAEDVSELRKIGHLLATLKEPEPPKGFKDVLGLGTLVKSLWDMAPRELRSAERSSRGAMSHKDFTSVPRPSTSLNPFGGSGSFRVASKWPILRNSLTSSAPIPKATRRGVPNRLPSTGIECPVG